jgi:hypothetical protein
MKAVFGWLSEFGLLPCDKVGSLTPISLKILSMSLSSSAKSPAFLDRCLLPDGNERISAGGSKDGATKDEPSSVGGAKPEFGLAFTGEDGLGADEGGEGKAEGVLDDLGAGANDWAAFS